MYDMLSFCNFIMDNSDEDTQLSAGLDFSRADPEYKPLSFEDADRILQNVLRACGYKEVHMKKDRCIT